LLANGDEVVFFGLKAIESLAGLHSFVYDSRLAPVSIVPFLL
jgi:hypothetical protein